MITTDSAGSQSKEPWRVTDECEVAGLLSIVFIPLCWLALPLGIYATIAGIRSLRRKKGRRGISAALILGPIGVCLSVLFFFDTFLPWIITYHALP